MSEFIGDCVGWPARHVRELCEMQERAIDIKRKTFLKRVGLHSVRELEENLGYQRTKKQGLTMKGDYHVAYYRSSLYGVRFYYVVQSGIEYVFGPDGFELNSAQVREETRQ